MERFTIDVEQSVLDDLKRRIRDTRWPPRVAGLGWDYGFDQDYLRELADSWLDYDWRAEEARINGFAHYRATIDDVPIHFIREPGKGPAPVPLVLTHGWPWTFWDMQKVIRPLADPAAYGGDPADAFEVIVPSLPGFAFSTPLPHPGINSVVTADLWEKLMTEVLGFPRYAAAGADWVHAPGYYLILVDQPGASTWPIVGATFILMQKNQAKVATAQTVLKFFDWAYKGGDALAASLDYIPLPAAVKTQIRATWKAQIKGPNGSQVYAP